MCFRFALSLQQKSEDRLHLNITFHARMKVLYSVRTIFATQRYKKMCYEDTDY